jgi:selenium metabolism protein YedF
MGIGPWDVSITRIPYPRPFKGANVKIVDCRNMTCPMPVVTVKRALEDSGGESLRVLLDDGPPRENVLRFAVNRGLMVEESSDGAGFALEISGTSVETPSAQVGKRGGSVLLVASDRFGDGPEELGSLLMKNFIISLLEVAETPERIFFLNRGIFLTTEGSEVIEALARLADRGVEIFSCGVCLDFFNVREKLCTGAITNMFTMAESMLAAGAVIRL